MKEKIKDLSAENEKLQTERDIWKINFDNLKIENEKLKADIIELNCRIEGYKGAIRVNYIEKSRIEKAIDENIEIMKGAGNSCFCIATHEELKKELLHSEKDVSQNTQKKTAICVETGGCPSEKCERSDKQDVGSKEPTSKRLYKSLWEDMFDNKKEVDE